MQRLTLCMIVKNEEAFLEGCLASVRDVVDAIVIVDTGCTDGTLAIARKYGARIVPHAWNDDFAAARNAALEHVPGGFVLVLDADERLAPGAKRALRKALARNDLDCGLLPLHDASRLDAKLDEVLSGRARRQDPQLLPRLLRRTPDLSWEGVVHEQVTAWARKHPRIVAVDAPIVHYGAVPELRAARSKSDRNLKLLEKRARLEPDNPIVLAYLARELERKGQAARALETARCAWRAVKAPEGQRPDCDAILPVTLLAYLAIRAGEIDEALRALAQARQWSAGHPNLDLLEGLAHEQRALKATTLEQYASDLFNAKAHYEALSAHRGKLFASEVMPGATGATGALRLATVELLLGELDAARQRFEEALRFEPNNLEARLGLAEVELDAGRPHEALQRASQLLEIGGADAWLLGAAAALALGSRDDARLFVERARGASATTPWAAPHRRARLDELSNELAQPSSAALAAEAFTASVVIPAYNRLDLLKTVLEGFREQQDVAPFELIVVDDGSQPPVRELWSTLSTPANWRLVEHERNRGRGAALNTGLAAASGDVVIFCDSDIAPSPQFVAEHLAFHHERNDELATCLGALEYGVDAGLIGELLGARSSPRLRDTTGPVTWTQWFTDNWSFRRSLLTTRELRFDERYKVWGWEELDLAWRLQQVGATNTRIAGARGRHLKAATMSGLLGSFARSVNNLELLASKLPDNKIVRQWLESRSATPAALEHAERALQIVHTRLEQLDYAAPTLVRDVRERLSHNCAVALSDFIFRVGLTRGWIELRAAGEAPHSVDAAAADRCIDETLHGLVRAVLQLELRVGAAAPASNWRHELAGLRQPVRAAV
jgi:glycosyltransferase involved in cell wall biosynthesis